MGDTIAIRKRTILYVLLSLFAIIILFLALFVTPSVVSATVLPADYSHVADMYTPNVTLRVTSGGYRFLDNRLTDAYSFNNQIPGPLLHGKVGETIHVHVINELDVPTTIHWHGLLVDNLEDGVPQVTQDPILPGESFDYSVALREPGLFWYHSHVDAHTQVESGLQGVLLVDDNSDSDPGTILVLDDVLLDSDASFRDFSVGRMHGRFGNVFLVNGVVHPEIDLSSNRLRIVNTANARSFTLSFDGKPFEVIGQDIAFSSPYFVSALTIHPGERYDILLNNDSDSAIDMRYVTSRGSASLATLLWDGSVSDVFIHNFSLPFSLDEALAMEPTFTASLRGFVLNRRQLVWSINDKYYPDNPEFFRASSGELVKVRLVNTQGQPHPMHLHGQKFVVLARNNVPSEHLGWKDTVYVGSGETVDIAFVAEPGDWVFHCHILEHAEAGMLSIVRVE